MASALFITRLKMNWKNVIHLLGLKNRAFVAPNIIDLAEYANSPIRNQFRNRYQIPQDKKIILFLGRIHWIKGLDTLITRFCQSS